MSRSRIKSLTHVRSYIEWVVETLGWVIERKNGKQAPIVEDELRRIKLIGEAILRKHAAKKTRKDIYVERK